MSYIRCLNNPEGLYIWGEKRDVVISLPDVNGRPGKMYRMPGNEFEGLFRKFNKRECDSDLHYSCGGARLIPVAGDDRYSKMRLGHDSWPKGRWVTAWNVTWHYIATTNTFDFYKEPIKCA